MALKSLAHPEWPYEGTAHEWRGFVKAEKPKGVRFEVSKNNFFVTDKKPTWDVRDNGRRVRLFATKDEAVSYANQQNAVYQKQNFGPDLD
jgi:hypothetical protein